MFENHRARYDLAIDGQSTGGDTSEQASSSFDSRSPQSSMTSSVSMPLRAEEWDRTLRHTLLEDFGKALENAASTIYLNDKKSRYSGVYVLLISWQTQDPKLPVQRELSCLRKVLEDVYHFDVEEFRIPDEDSHGEVNEKINSFVKVNKNSSEDLKIVYYAGHSRLSRTKELLWSTLLERNTKCPIVVWSGIQRALEMAKSDTLILLDCCSAGVANESEGNGATELICACAFDAKANGVGHYSFTQALITELRLLSKKSCFSVGELYTSVYTRIQSYLAQGVENERYPAPIHLVLTKDEPYVRGIRLSILDQKIPDQGRNRKCCPKREKESSPPPKKRTRLDDSLSPRIEQIVLPWIEESGSIQADGQPDGFIVHSQDENQCTTHEATHQGQEAREGSRRCPPKDSLYPRDAPRALFVVRFKEDIRGEDLSVDLFKEWLRSIPAAVAEVCVEAGFKCYSTLLLITVPLSMYPYISQHPAVFFLGAVTSSIFLPLNQRKCPSSQHDAGTNSCREPAKGKGKTKAVSFAELEPDLNSMKRFDSTTNEPEGIMCPNPTEAWMQQDPVSNPADPYAGGNQEMPAFQVSDGGKIYTRNILDKFPEADLQLVQRLGEANWQRHIKIRSRKEKPEQDFEFPQEIAAASIFHDSGLGSSITPSSYAASLCSFVSKAGDADSGYFRVPQTPKEVAAGKPFECFICGLTLWYIKNRVAWKRHVFADLRPYICTQSSCNDKLCTFVTRTQWANHESNHHRGPKSLPDAQLSTLIESVSPIRDLVYENSSARAHDRKVTASRQTGSGGLVCPLCQASFRGLKQKYLSHVAKHMESISLAALPTETEDVSECDSNGNETLSEPRTTGLVSFNGARQALPYLPSSLSQDTLDSDEPGEESDWGQLGGLTPPGPSRTAFEAPRPFGLPFHLGHGLHSSSVAPTSAADVSPSLEDLSRVDVSNLDLENITWDHSLYHNATTHVDGLYHCPFEKIPTAHCTHKPEKLKCNYDKNLDSHLKPYRCKVHKCHSLRFSSVACLFRHEREAHAKLGSGARPYRCPHVGCERGIEGNGFPRHWNLRDHMKRVHDEELKEK